MRREEAEKKKYAEEVRKQPESAAVEDEDEEDEEELEVGPSAPKKRKVQDMVSDGPTSLHTKANGVIQEVRQLTRWNTPQCGQCMIRGAVCFRKLHGPSCWQCYKHKMSCSLVIQKRKEERKGSCCGGGRGAGRAL